MLAFATQQVAQEARNQIKKQQRKQEIRSGAVASGRYGTLAGIEDLLGAFQPPTGPFDPEGSWKQAYQMHLGSDGQESAPGFLEIRREVSGAGLTLFVEMQVLHMTGGLQQTTAKIACANDPLCSPKSWQLESVLADPTGRPLESTRMASRATVKAGAVEAEFGKHKRTIKLPGPFTSNWSLFDAVHHLRGKDTAPLRFALLEDLDLLKPNHRLSFAETASVKAAGGRELKLTGYEQIGEGVLPFHYWLDEQGRLLFVLSGPRAYIYDPEARAKVTDARQRGRRKA